MFAPAGSKPARCDCPSTIYSTLFIDSNSTEMSTDAVTEETLINEAIIAAYLGLIFSSKLSISALCSPT